MSFLNQIWDVFDLLEGFKLNLHELLIILIAICGILCFTYIFHMQSKPTKRVRRRKNKADLSSPPRRSNRLKQKAQKAKSK
mmetsp:Transcript_74059/g.66644  ORF Transcript_74059/g.66644 Transcript_74059/m.66644 type:complete len:81 (-) Transcript_74059:144-386(-)